MNSLWNWLDDRTGCRHLLHELLYENVPGGARWRYVWGSTLVFTFMVQVVTGFFLWAAYSPSAQTAWESVYYIQHEIQGGWLLRGLHHFTAQAMVVLLALHLMQVVIDGAYKAPREVNFWLGLILMQIVLGLSLTGYLLPWDQKGYWATKVATNIAGITPLVGSDVQRVLVGGSTYGHHTLTRFFALHAGLLPALLVGFLVLHIYVFRRHGITAPNKEWRPNATFWPDQVFKDAVACLAVLATVLLLAIWHGVGPHGGAELGAPADGAEPYSAARPEWYFLFLFQFLKYFPGETEVIGAMVIPGLVLLVLFLMPFMGRWQLGHRFNLVFLLSVFAGIGFLTVAAWRADRNDAAYQAGARDAEVKSQLIKAWVAERGGVGPHGAVQIMRSAGLFAKNCGSCHRFNGHDGAGVVSNEPATAADLGNFGSRAWIHGILTDFAGEKHFGATDRNPLIGNRFISGEKAKMAAWTKEHVASQLMTPDEVAAVSEFLTSLGERGGPGTPIDAALAQRGRAFFVDGSDAVTESCASCHLLKIDKKSISGEDDPPNGPAPELTGYASRAWLREFIRNPAKYYGDRNAMPAFEGKLSDGEIDAIADWLLVR